MSWLAIEIKRKEAIPPCAQCSRTEKVVTVGTIIEGVDKEYELVPIWHCDFCNVVFPGIGPKTLTAIDKSIRFGSGTICEVKESKTTKKGPHDIKTRVSTFRLK